MIEKNSEKTIESDVDKNISSGKKVMDKVIAQHTDVENAMYREDVGSISFVGGTTGKGNKLKRGSGIAHIIAKRDFENSSVINTAYKMVEVLAKGKVTQRQESEYASGQPRVKIEFDNYTAVLSFTDKTGTDKKTWLLTGWEKNKEVTANANGEGYDSSVATSTKPTLTRLSGEDITSIKPQYITS